MKNDGSFGAGNPKAAASKQPSSSTTTNTTDTSGARELAPAPDAEAREAQEGWSESASLNAGKGLGKEAGVGPTYNTSGKETFSATRGNETGSSTGVTGGYAGAAESAQDPGVFKPKGNNINEGGFPKDSQNASFNNAEIGSKDDPGRVAEQNFAQKNAKAPGDGVREGQVSDSTVYDALKSSENA